MAADGSKTALTDLCKERYEPLLKYFAGLTLSDLEDLGEEDLYEVAAPEHRLLMKLFVKQKGFQSYFNRTAPDVVPSQGQKFPFKTADGWAPEDRVLKKIVLSGESTASVVLNFASVFNMSKFTQLALLFPSKYPTAHELLAQGARVVLVSFSENMLQDSALLDVLEFMRVMIGLDSKNYLRARYIDLSLNRFYGLASSDFDSTFVQLVRQTPYAVDVRGNPMATIDKKDLFVRLSEELRGSEEGSQPLITKVIWVPEQYLEPRAWTIMLSSKLEGLDKKSLIEMIQNAHRAYFELRRSLEQAKPQ